MTDAFEQASGNLSDLSDFDLLLSLSSLSFGGDVHILGGCVSITLIVLFGLFVFFSAWRFA